MKPAHILVIRNSAMGDVAMTVPVLKQLLEQYPHVSLTVITQPQFFPIFSSLVRTELLATEIKQRHKGIAGAFRLFADARKKNNYTGVADLHNVLRSQLVRTLFRLTGTAVAAIDKGRKEKKELTREENKKLRQLKTTFQRYADVFAKLGFPVQLIPGTPVYSKQNIPTAASSLFADGKKKLLIAPFAKHAEKMYPAEKMKAVIALLQENKQLQIFLLGGGKQEKEILSGWQHEFPEAINITGLYSLEQELALISNMDAVISMDSANMHLASLFHIPVISVWGATHPYLGFYGWGQDKENAAQIAIYCNPCSVFGNKPCYRGDRACMHELPEAMIVEKLVKLLGI